MLCVFSCLKNVVPWFYIPNQAAKDSTLSIVKFTGSECHRIREHLTVIWCSGVGHCQIDSSLGHWQWGRDTRGAMIFQEGLLQVSGWCSLTVIGYTAASLWLANTPTLVKEPKVPAGQIFNAICKLQNLTGLQKFMLVSGLPLKFYTIYLNKSFFRWGVWCKVCAWNDIAVLSS